MPRWVQARKRDDPLPHPPFSCSPSRFPVSLQLNLVSFLRGFRFGPVLFVLWRPLDPGSASPQSGFLQHHRLLRGVRVGGCREEGGTGLGVVAKGCGSTLACLSLPSTGPSFPPPSSTKYREVHRRTAGAVESGEVLKWPGRSGRSLDWQSRPVTDRGSPWRPRGQSAHPSSGAG